MRRALGYGAGARSASRAATPFETGPQYSRASSFRLLPPSLLLLLLLLAAPRARGAASAKPMSSSGAPNPLVGGNGKIQKPNLVFAMIDDWGFYEVGFRGNSLAQTPFIDKMIGQSLLIERHYSYRYCSPARRSFLSGRLPPHVGQSNAADATIDLRMATIADTLTAAGYVTGHSGKVSMPTKHGSPYATHLLFCVYAVENVVDNGIYHVQWHAGFFSMEQVPHSRGFSTSLGFLYGVDHWVRRHSQTVDRTCHY